MADDASDCPLQTVTYITFTYDRNFARISPSQRQIAATLSPWSALQFNGKNSWRKIWVVEEYA